MDFSSALSRIKAGCRMTRTGVDEFKRRFQRVAEDRLMHGEPYHGMAPNPRGPSGTFEPSK